ncbi:S1 family peptidase [Streptomyces xinghaiensis]
MEDFAYPNAAEIRAEKGIALHRGDGRLLLADCDGSSDQVQVWTRQTADGKYCFRALADSGYVTLEVPDVYALQTADHPVSADLTANGETETVDVAKDEFRGVGEGNGGDPTVLVELRAHPFMAKIDIGGGERGCSGALVAPQWIATAAACFAEDLQQGAPPPAGKPSLDTVATVGRTDLSSPTGQVADVVELVPRDDRDLVLARLAKPVTGITPVPVSAVPAASGETLTVAGYGRTATEWVPDRLHTSSFTVDAVEDGSLALTGATAESAICKGDTGGPALRETDGRVELVAVSSSWQGGCLGSDETRTGAVSSRVDDLGAWIADRAAAAPVTDFNCDGQRDVAVGDPRATVGGDESAGLVRVVYGGGKGTAEIHQDLAAVPGGAEAEDWYGESLAVFDHNLDGCTDLVVGVPAEDLGGAADTGMVNVLYGDPAGLTRGKPALNLEQGKGTGSLGASTSEAGDRLGHAVAAGHTDTGLPYLVAGLPGEDLGDIRDAGSSVYLLGTTNVGVHQDTAGVPGAPEKNDRFGAAVSASPRHLAIGIPGEAIGDKASAGGTQILAHGTDTGAAPEPLGFADQDNTGINGSAESGDQFGAAVAMTGYRPSGATSATDTLLAVGSPGEGLDGMNNAGRVVVLQISAAGKATQRADIQQDVDGVSGGAEAGDLFGRYLSAVNTAPGAESTAGTMLLAVGIPGEDLGRAEDSGAIQVFSLLGEPGATDVWIEPGLAGLPGAPGTEERLGTAFTATGTHLYVGMPYGPTQYGAVHTVPWANVTDGADEPVTTHQPGQGGLPAAGRAFGRAVR